MLFALVRWTSFACLCMASLPVAAQTTWATVDQLVERLAREPYQASPPLPENLRSWKYDDYRFVAFEGAHAVWKGTESPFRLEFFHPGYIFHDEVRVHLVEQDRTETVRFDRRLFQYRGPLSDIQLPDRLEFAGVRVVGKFANSTDFQEMIVFLGASYFRAVGRGQVYGTSSRGLAINIGMPVAEEFPAFREFWIARPKSGSDRLTMWARLDGPSVAGAYQFDWEPGESTRCQVRAKLYFRHAVQKVGLAPLTSMWSWGDGLPGPSNDPRPHVHDSDGLLIRTSADVWIWRPLGRQSYPSVSRYDLAEVRGFGLLQRNREPADYRDNEAKYDRRPSVWIEPHETWGDGAIELLELPGEHEGIDSIAAWWTPRVQPSPQKPLELNYTISFGNEEPRHDLARAVKFTKRRVAGVSQLTVDFEGGANFARTPLDELVPNVQVLRGRAENFYGEMTASGYRLRFEARPESDQPMELTAVAQRRGAVVTETWRYLCQP